MSDEIVKELLNALLGHVVVVGVLVGGLANLAKRGRGCTLWEL